MPSTEPYGSWESPVTADLVAGEAREFAHVAVDDGTVYWLERRPDEDGRGVVCRAVDGEAAEVTPADANVRTLVHEYGGGDVLVADGTVWYAEFADQRLYRQPVGGDAEAITPEPETQHGLRYADMELTPDGETIYAVRERHEGPGSEDEAVTELVRLPADGGDGADPAEPTVVASGHDFYSFPRVSPDGGELVWTTWDHPRMPWDGTELHRADIADDGSLTDERVVMGGPEESVFQPSWRDDGTLFAVSDRTGWWHIYRVGDGASDDAGAGVAGVDAGADPEPVTEGEAEFGTPQWGFGLSTYTFLDDGTVAAVRNGDGRQELCTVDPAEGPASLTVVDCPFDVFPRTKLVSDGERLAAIAGAPGTPTAVVEREPDGEWLTRRASFSLPFDADYVSEPEHVAFPTGESGSETAYTYYYPPTNPEFEAPDGERPPLVTMVHGGPTGQTFPVLNLLVQYFTSRGIAVADVNYRGSTGYGRAYRDRLQGEWGIVDTEDCVNAATYLAEQGLADPDRLAIRGGSAGGYATLCALTFHDAFDAGASYFGVADLKALAEDTHKFESRYLDGLVGPLPEAEDVYRERSPVYHADGIRAPLLVLQGGEDQVVPQAQADQMVDALVETGVPYSYLLFPEERHGFRTEAARRTAQEAELAFYGKTFGFTPADDLFDVELVEGERRVQTVGE